MKVYSVYWRFKGKQFFDLPWNSTLVKANTKKEAAESVKESLDSIKIIRVDLVNPFTFQKPLLYFNINHNQ